MDIRYECSRCGRRYPAEVGVSGQRSAAATFAVYARRPVRACDACGDVGTDVVLTDEVGREVRREPANVAYDSSGARLEAV